MATDVKITVSSGYEKGMTGWIQKIQTLLNMLLQRGTMISIWTTREAAESTNADGETKSNNRGRDSGLEKVVRDTMGQAAVEEVLKNTHTIKVPIQQRRNATSK